MFRKNTLVGGTIIRKVVSKKYRNGILITSNYRFACYSSTKMKHVDHLQISNDVGSFSLVIFTLLKMRLPHI